MWIVYGLNYIHREKLGKGKGKESVKCYHFRGMMEEVNDWVLDNSYMDELTLLYYNRMNIQEQIKYQQQKKKLQADRQQRIKRKLIAKQREKVNLDQSHLKTGKMQKTKIIQKKKYDTEVQKSRKIVHEIQDNANPGTYIGESQEYQKVLERTKNYIKFDKKTLETGCQAITAFAQANKQKTIDIILTMQNQIQCHQTPIFLKPPFPQPSPKCILLLPPSQKIQKNLLPTSDIEILSIPQFLTKTKQDKQTKKLLHKKLLKLFTNFHIFTKNKTINRLLQKQIPAFPIDTKKVPYTVAHQFKDYHSYLDVLMHGVFFVARTGSSLYLFVFMQCYSG